VLFNFQFKTFDLAIMNEVLHELPPGDEYRRSAFSDIYTLLKDGGILIINEYIVPDTFEPNHILHL